MKNKFSFFQVLTLIVLFGLVATLITFKTIQKVKASGIGDSVNLHVLTEGKTASSATWLNYSGNYSPGGQTITANPGDTINFRIRVWNDGIVIADNTDISGTVTNSGDVSSLAVTNDDLDGDTLHFTGFHFTGGGDGTVAAVLSGGTKDVADQGLSGTVTLGNNFPVGQTVIVGEVTIAGYTAEQIGFNPSLFGNAHADGAGVKSAVRIVVDVPAPALPSTGKISVKNFLSVISEFIKK